MNIDIKKILELFKKKHILVVGDVMVDKYLQGNVNRISPEAPVPIVNINSKFSHAGGAANVARNINGLGGLATLVGIIGDDNEGLELSNILKQDNRIIQNLVIDKSRKTTVKTRILGNQQQLIRLDEEDKFGIQSFIFDKIIDNIKKISIPIDGIIIQDYDKGFISEKLVSWLMFFSSKNNIPVYVDPKINILSGYDGVRLFKPNQKEFDRFAGDYEDFTIAAFEMVSKHKYQILLVTKGNEGMSLFNHNEQINIMANIKQVHDVSGAGDTVISTFALCDCSDLEPDYSANISNFAASKVCDKVGVVPITKKLLSENIDKYFN